MTRKVSQWTKIISVDYWHNNRAPDNKTFRTLTISSLVVQMKLCLVDSIPKYKKYTDMDGIQIYRNSIVWYNVYGHGIWYGLAYYDMVCAMTWRGI